MSASRERQEIAKEYGLTLEDSDWYFDVSVLKKHDALQRIINEFLDLKSAATADMDELLGALRRSREFLIQWRDLNPRSTSQLGTDTDSFTVSLTAALARYGK